MVSAGDNVVLSTVLAKDLLSRDAMLLALQQQLERNAVLQSQLTQRSETIETLQEQSRLAIAQLFGKSSEKTGPNQRELFNEAELLAEQAESDLEAEKLDEDSDKPYKEKLGHKGLSPDLPRERVEHLLSDEECAGAVETFFTKVKEELNIEPAKACVREHWP